MPKQKLSVKLTTDEYPEGGQIRTLTMHLNGQPWYSTWRATWWDKGDIRAEYVRAEDIIRGWRVGDYPVGSCTDVFLSGVIG